jgi:allophanate hydrolase
MPVAGLTAADPDRVISVRAGLLLAAPRTLLVRGAALLRAVETREFSFISVRFLEIPGMAWSMHLSGMQSSIQVVFHSMTSTTAHSQSLSIASLQAAYADGARPVDVIAHAYDRIAAQTANPIWISLVPRERALAAASALPRQAPRCESRPLWGVPFAVKDNIDVAGLETTAACPQFAYRATASATAVERLTAAGAILLGKTNLDQFATGLVGTRSPYGACRNAFDERFISGGSSSGSAVAVALGMVSFALGTDTAGSGRVPAAFNNIVGMKPTRGLVSAAGVVPACRSLDCVSIFATSCADADTVLEVLAGVDARDPYTRPRGAGGQFDSGCFRFAVPRAEQLRFFGDAEYAALYRAACERLRALGGTCVEIDYTPYFEAQRLLYDGPWVAERYAALGAFIKAHPDALHPVTQTVIAAGRHYSAVDAFEGQYRLTELARDAAENWAKADVLVVPTAATIYTHAEVQGNPLELNARLGIYTNFVNLFDLAALAVPVGFRADGLPFGVSLIGPAFSDEALAHLGARLHHACVSYAGASVAAVPPASVSARRSLAQIAVVGAHLSGMPLEGELTRRGARLLRATRTCADYRLYALPNTAPPKPGLVRVAPGEGAPIAVEVWEMPLSQFGSLVADVPSPLAIGTLTLEDRSSVQGFLCEAQAIVNASDITAYGGWRAYLAARTDDRPRRR